MANTSHSAIVAALKILTIILLGGLLWAGGARALQPEYALDHVLIKFKSTARVHVATISGTNSYASLLRELNLPAGTELRENEMTRLVREGKLIKGVQPSNKSALDLDHFMLLYLAPELSVEACLAKLKDNPLIEYTEVDGIRHLQGMVIPNDPYYPQQWHHPRIHTPEAWSITTGSSNVIVGVLDSGVNTNAEFTGRLVAGHNFSGDIGGTTDGNGHGTPVAGIICANANNSVLVAGVDWQCRLMPIRISNSGGTIRDSAIISGIDFGVSNGCKVLNLSAGGSTTNSGEERSITNAIAKGVIFVAAAGNSGTNSIGNPAAFGPSIAVGATDQNDLRASFSNYGPQLDLVAPGMFIYGFDRYGDILSSSGTSASTPLVAGVCSLLAAIKPDITQEQARKLLCAGADDQVGDAFDTPGFDIYYGWGRLNAYNTLVLAQTRIETTTFSPSNTLIFSWTSPPNAPTKEPYQMEASDSPVTNWFALTNGAFTYTSDRTFWTENSPFTDSTARFYRVKIRQD